MFSLQVIAVIYVERKTLYFSTLFRPELFALYKASSAFLKVFSMLTSLWLNCASPALTLTKTSVLPTTIGLLQILILILSAKINASSIVV